MKISAKARMLNSLRRIFTIPFLEKILLRFTVDKSPHSFFAKLIPNNYQYAPNTCRFVTRSGIRFKVDLYDYIGWWIYFGLKDHSRSKLYALAAKDDTIIDIGTNIGETLLNFARLTFPHGEVHGFEPDPVNHRHCAENVNLNGFTNITLNNLGLGAKPGQYYITTGTPSNRGGNKVSAEYIENNTQEITIVQLDAYVAAKNIPKIELIKIDVEGYELHVLQGAVQIIERFKPVFFIELDDSNLREQGHSAKSLIHFLSAYDYSITHAETDEVITELTDFTGCHYDIICIPEKS